MGRRPSRIECGRFLYKIERFYLVSLEMEDWKMVLSSKPVRVAYFFFFPLHRRGSETHAGHIYWNMRDLKELSTKYGRDEPDFFYGII